MKVETQELQRCRSLTTSVQPPTLGFAHLYKAQLCRTHLCRVYLCRTLMCRVNLCRAHLCTVYPCKALLCRAHCAAFCLFSGKVAAEQGGFCDSSELALQFWSKSFRNNYLHFCHQSGLTCWIELELKWENVLLMNTLSSSELWPICSNLDCPWQVTNSWPHKSHCIVLAHRRMLAALYCVHKQVNTQPVCTA